MSITLSTEPSRVQVERVYGWLRETYWCKGIRFEVLQKAIENSLIYSAFEGEQQVGFARVVSDQATFAWLCDVFVEEAYRGRGIATLLVKAVLADPRLATLRRICLATKDAHHVYAPLGFVPVAPDVFMELQPPRQSWSTLP